MIQYDKKLPTNQDSNLLPFHCKLKLIGHVSCYLLDLSHIQKVTVQIQVVNYVLIYSMLPEEVIAGTSSFPPTLVVALQTFCLAPHSLEND